MKRGLLRFWFAQLLIVVAILFSYRYFNHILEAPEYNYKEHTHHTLYVDTSFSDEEKQLITIAAITWSQRTHHMITFDVVMLPTIDDLDRNDGILIGKLSNYNSDILELDTQNNGTTLGYYTHHGYMPSIYLVASRIDAEDYETVVLHELGHSLGLKHNSNPNDYGTLMYPSVEMSSDYITDTDIINLCKIYECDADELNNK